MTARNNIPSYEAPFMNGKINSKDWFFFLVGLYTGIPPETEAPVTLGTSPYVYNAPKRGSVMVSGGTVSLIEFSRDGTTYYNTGQTSGGITVGAQDFLRITYTVAPTAVFVPT